METKPAHRENCAVHRSWWQPNLHEEFRPFPDDGIINTSPSFPSILEGTPFHPFVYVSKLLATKMRWREPNKISHVHPVPAKIESFWIKWCPYRVSHKKIWESLYIHHSSFMMVIGIEYHQLTPIIFKYPPEENAAYVILSLLIITPIYDGCRIFTSSPMTSQTYGWDETTINLHGWLWHCFTNAKNHHYQSLSFTN